MDLDRFDALIFTALLEEVETERFWEIIKAAGRVLAPGRKSGHMQCKALRKLLLLLLLQGCVAGRMEGVGGSGFAVQLGPELEEDAREQARSVEAERVRGELWAVGAVEDAPGASWRFRYWSEGGALTLLSFQRTQAGEGRAAPVDADAFLPQFARGLPALLGTGAQEVIFTLTRNESGWAVDLDTSTSETPPPQARTLPSPRLGVSPDTYGQVLAAARGMARLMRASAGSHSRLEVEILLEDHQVMGWQPVKVQAPGDGRVVDGIEVTRAATALQPFTQALGVRTLTMVLEVGHPAGSASGSWRVVEARTGEPPKPPPELEDIAQEYRAMHERILYDFQHEARESAVLLAGIGMEQLAYWYVGGLIARGAFVLFEATAPTVVAFASRGGTTAVRWFRNLLARTPAAERALLESLWLKAETRGLQSLTALERAELRALMGRLERVLSTPLSSNAKRLLHKWAREEYFQLYNPQLAELLGEAGVRQYEVHHIYSLQYAHLFPALDINGRANLAGVAKPVHESISAVWASLGRASEHMQARDVTRMVEIVNKHYSRWFDKVYATQDTPALLRAYQAAVREVAELKAQLIR